MRPLISLLLVVFAWAAAASAADAAQYPARPIRLIVPFAPGGTVDVIARLIGARIGETSGQQVVVDNRGGAGGVVGTELVVRAAPDGYTLLLHSAALAYEPALRAKLPYDALKDLAPISVIGATPNLLVVHPAFTARSARDLVQLAKQKPGAVTYGTGGIGSSSHLAVELFRNLAGVTFNHVPYKGAGPALIEVMAGQIDFMIATMPGAVTHVRSTRLRALGISTLKRSPELPEVPTIAESGVPGYDYVAWFGLLGPAALPPALVTNIQALFAGAVNHPELKKRLEGEGVEPLLTTPPKFRATLAAETARWKKIIEAAGIKAAN
jgi:tripartite-type tricarboxylate transporter receptor subunit TctC